MILLVIPQKLALTSPKSGGCSVGIARSRTKAAELSYKLTRTLTNLLNTQEARTPQETPLPRILVTIVTVKQYPCHGNAISMATNYPLRLNIVGRSQHYSPFAGISLQGSGPEHVVWVRGGGGDVGGGVMVAIALTIKTKRSDCGYAYK
jgi:hypothetical protein